VQTAVLGDQQAAKKIHRKQVVPKAGYGLSLAGLWIMDMG